METKYEVQELWDNQGGPEWTLCYQRKTINGSYCPNGGEFLNLESAKQYLAVITKTKGGKYRIVKVETETKILEEFREEY